VRDDAKEPLGRDEWSLVVRDIVPARLSTVGTEACLLLWVVMASETFGRREAAECFLV
jgi:hypothetical protein